MNTISNSLADIAGTGLARHGLQLQRRRPDAHTLGSAAHASAGDLCPGHRRAADGCPQ